MAHALMEQWSSGIWALSLVLALTGQITCFDVCCKRGPAVIPVMACSKIRGWRGDSSPGARPEVKPTGVP